LLKQPDISWLRLEWRDERALRGGAGEASDANHRYILNGVRETIDLSGILFRLYTRRARTRLTATGTGA
jgi:hypothetical protein